jgi:hypothetical protein
MVEKQQTFGKTKIVELNGKVTRNPYCNYSENGEKCGNRAILKIVNSLQVSTEYRCGLHAKKWHLEEIDYEKP